MLQLRNTTLREYLREQKGTLSSTKLTSNAIERFNKIAKAVEAKTAYPRYI